MQVYISCPLDEDLSKIIEVGKKLQDMGYKPWWYVRGETYNDSKLRISDMFVLIPTNNQFDFTWSRMTAGCLKELGLARDLGKKLYLAYWKKDKLNIYSIHPDKLEDDRVLGMSKTYLQPLPKELIINNYPIY